MSWVMASTIARACDDVCECVLHLTQDASSEGRIGVLTTNDVKERMYVDLLTRMKVDTVGLFHHFKGDSTTLLTQLREYRYEFKKGKDDFSRSKLTLTGKSTYMNDDICVALQMLCYWSNYYITFPSAAVSFFAHHANIQKRRRNM